MKKRILAIIACGVIVTTTAGFGTMVSAEAADIAESADDSETDDIGREYVNEFDPDTNQVLDLYEVEFQIPGNWEEVDYSGGIVYDSDSDNGRLSIAAGNSALEDLTSEKVQDELIASLDGGDSFIETGREIVTILDYVPALYVTCTQNISGIPADEYVLAFFTGNIFYIFSYVDRQDSGYNHSQEFDEIINSISWAPKTTYYDLSFWVPDTWTDSSSDEEQLTYQSEYGQLLVYSDEGSFGADYMGIEKNQDDFISAYEEQDSYELSDRQTITVLEDTLAFYFTCSFLLSGEPMNFAIVVFGTDDRLYSFMFGEYDSYDDSEMDYFYDIIYSITWATADLSNDFFGDDERREEYEELCGSYQMSELYDYVQQYISDAGEEISPDDSAYTITECIEPLLDYTDLWAATKDEFDGSYSVSFTGADDISSSESIDLNLKGSYLKVTIGFQKNGWLFFDHYALSIDGEVVQSAKINSTNREDDIISGGTIQETYSNYSLFKDDVCEQIKDAGTAILRFENSSNDEIYDHTLTDAEKTAVYVSNLLRNAYVELSNLPSNITK